MRKAISRMKENRSLGTVTDWVLAIWGRHLGNTGIYASQLRRQVGHRKGRGALKPGGTELAQAEPPPALLCNARAYVYRMKSHHTFPL